jgi:simple sugar transport system ATP-binding protein
VRERARVNELAVQLKQQGLLVIYITHDIFQIHRIADRIVIMENGRKVADVGRDVLSAEALEEIIREGGRKAAKGQSIS